MARGSLSNPRATLWVPSPLAGEGQDGGSGRSRHPCVLRPRQACARATTICSSSSTVAASTASWPRSRAPSCGSARSSGAGATRRGRRRRTTTCSWACCRTPARRTCTRRSTTSRTSPSYNQRLGADGIEFKHLLPSLYLPTVPHAHARLPHARAGLAAGAQPGHPAQPRLRLLHAHADPQRHGGDARAR